MNKLVIFASSLIVSISLTSAHAEDGTKLSTDKQKFSYGIGLQVGQSLLKQNLDIDDEAFGMAIRDALSEAEPRVSIEELQKVMVAQEQKMLEEKDAAAKENLEAGKAFSEKNAKLDGVKTLDNGIQYKVIKAGSGTSPTIEDTVTVHYKGTLISGEEFDSSYTRGEPATFPLNGVIKGWQEILPQMKEDAKWEVLIPSDLAYGPNGAGGAIGPNETLVFEIELLKVDKKAAE